MALPSASWKVFQMNDPTKDASLRGWREASPRDECPILFSTDPVWGIRSFERCERFPGSALPRRMHAVEPRRMNVPIEPVRLSAVDIRRWWTHLTVSSARSSAAGASGSRPAHAREIAVSRVGRAG